jgi:hypothetical protein
MVPGSPDRLCLIWGHAHSGGRRTSALEAGMAIIPVMAPGR